ncbi:AraC family transcriptional regulator [Sphingomonas crusticola]|uniref:AraC family transcriptional regulator n=1 Tax=Sphingomonas crusticola TaxID=1697973 RepID=UPI000E26D3C1|nr:helix-turn-helix domain-containing protein [Sphingomonas crusticola]
MNDLVFGWRTATLTVAIIQLLLIAAALSRPIANRVANRTLSFLLLTLAGIVTPWAIGFAGFYDHWHWLTFAPFSITLAVAPLLWLYVKGLVDGEWPPRSWWHLAPAAVQFLFLLSGFLLPMGLKSQWADIALLPYGAAAGVATTVGLIVYGIASLRAIRRYRSRMADVRSDDARYALRWLTRIIGANLLLLPIWSGYAIWDAVAPLGYRRLMGLYVAIAAFALYLAIEGWRHATLPFPRLVEADPLPTATRDWEELGTRWAAIVRQQGWAADPELSSALLARKLGTNTSYLSRALNEGLGIGFSTFINQLRSEAVAAALSAGDRRDVLDLAFEAGFASKASFNRAFQASFGMSPSAYRRVSLHK